MTIFNYHGIDIMKMTEEKLDEIIDLHHVKFQCSYHITTYNGFCSIFRNKSKLEDIVKKQLYILTNVIDEQFMFSLIESFFVDNDGYITRKGLYIAVRLIHMLYGKNTNNDEWDINKTQDDIIVYRILNSLKNIMNIEESLDNVFEHRQCYVVNGKSFHNGFILNEKTGKKAVISNHHFPKRTIEYKRLKKKMKNIDKIYDNDNLWELYMFDQVNENKHDHLQSEMLNYMVEILFENRIFICENVEGYKKNLKRFFIQRGIPLKWLKLLVPCDMFLIFVMGLSEKNTSLHKFSKNKIYDRNVLGLIKLYL